MSTKKKTNKGKRYTAEEKQEILNYVAEVNATKGRGGQSAASKKFKISPLTISSWLKASGSPPSGSSASSAKVPTSGPIGRKLEKLKTLHAQIERTEKELQKLHAQFEALKASL